MNNNIASLLTNVYEIEGLLLVVARHGQDTPSLVYKRIQKAAQDLNNQCQALAYDNDEWVEDQTAKQEPAPQPVEVPAPQPVQEPEQPTAEVSPEIPVEDREPDEDIEFEFVYDDDEPMEQSQQSDEDQPVTPFSFEDKPAAINDAVGGTETDNEATTTPPAWRDPAKDLRKSFSLNDYYRFRRELFQGDEAAMNTVLDHIQELKTTSEVRAFLFDQLDWDKNSDDVKDFLEIVNNLFA